MEVQLPVSELRTALSGLSKVVNKSSRLPVLQSIRIARSADGSMQLQATDLDSLVSYRLNGTQPGEAGELLVPFEPFNKTVKGCAATAQVTLTGNGKGVILQYPLAGRFVEQPLESLAPNEWPPAPAIEATPILVDSGFKDAVSNAFACCSEESSRPALNGAWVDVTDPKAHYVMGTDGRHLFSANSFNLDLKQSLLIPDVKFLHWSGFNEDGPWKLAAQPGKKKDDAGWLQLQSDHWTFITRKPDHTIPNWRQVVPTDGTAKLTVIFSKAATEFLLELLPKLPGKDDRSRPITLEVMGGQLKIIARERNSEHRTSIPVEDVEVSGRGLAISVNRDFVAKALKFGLTVMELTDELSPIVFSAAGKRLLAMPVHPDAPPAPPVEQAPTPQPENPQPKEEPMPRTSATPPAENARESQPAQRTVPTNGEAASSVRSVIDQIDGIKEALKAVVRQFGDVVDVLRQVEKAKKTNDKEVEGVREKLRAIQSVTL